MAKTVKPQMSPDDIHYEIHVFFLGHWESVNVHGDTRRFEAGTSEPVRTREYKTKEKAINAGLKTWKHTSFRVYRIHPPESLTGIPNPLANLPIEWAQECVYQHE